MGFELDGHRRIKEASAGIGRPLVGAFLPTAFRRLLGRVLQDLAEAAGRALLELLEPGASLIQASTSSRVTP